jgi:hypothetical protein
MPSAGKGYLGNYSVNRRRKTYTKTLNNNAAAFPQAAGIQWGSSTGFPVAGFGGHLFNLTRLFTSPPSKTHK